MMKHTQAAFLLFILFACRLTVTAQSILPQGYFASEANTISAGSDILVSIKKYNPTEDEIKKANNYKKGEPMNYLVAPFEITNASLFDKGFESVLYMLNKNGQIKWQKSLGYSEKTTPSPVKISGGFIYTGEAEKEADKVLVQKIGPDGAVVWKKELDSLHNVNDIYVDAEIVNLLVSFDFSERVEGGREFSIRTHAVYFFMQLDILTGAVIKKQYQRVGNYLSGMNFSYPVLNSSYSFFLNNRDTAFYLNINNQESATSVFGEASRNYSILELAAGPEAYHILTRFDSAGQRSYRLVSDFYAQKKKYEAVLQVPYLARSRSFLHKTMEDSVLAVISGNKDVYITYVDGYGRTTTIKRTSEINSPVLGIGELAGKVYLIKMEGRDKPGTIGTMRLEFP